MSNFLLSFLNDIASVAGIPTDTFATAFKGFLEKRKNILREAILCEIRGGNFSNVSNNDKIAIAYKLYQSAIEGVAKNNLHLMCQIINGMEQKSTLVVPNFLRYAQILATLSEDEIIALGVMAQYHPPSIEKNLSARDKKIKEKIGNKVEAIQSALTRTGLVTVSIETEIIPKDGRIPKK